MYDATHDNLIHDAVLPSAQLAFTNNDKPRVQVNIMS